MVTRLGSEGVGERTGAARAITVAVTVRNDRDGLRELIQALLAQTRRPDEIVIVDGGSVDGTPEVVSEFDVTGMNLRLLVRDGANIAAGRNTAVRVASHDRIAITDAGCRPEPNWLEALDDALDHADLVNGIFVADGKSEFEKVIAVTHYPVPDELNDPTWWVRLSHCLFGRAYSPYWAGTRSLAFKRAAWQAAGAFPENMYPEDRVFVQAAIDQGVTTVTARDAVVHWTPRETWAATAEMFYRYCRGDIRAKGRSRHVLRAIAWTTGPVAAIRGGWATRSLITAAAFAYIALPVHRARQAGLSRLCWWQIPLAVAVKDLSQIAGAAHGALDAWRDVPQPIPHR